MRAAIWQPMSTAPRDGTIVDLHLTGGGRYTDAWWEEEDKSWCGLEEEMFDRWAPLPVCPITPPERVTTKGLFLFGALFMSMIGFTVFIFWLITIRGGK